MRPGTLHQRIKPNQVGTFRRLAVARLWPLVGGSESRANLELSLPWISLAEYEYGGKKCIGFANGCIGEDGLDPDVWYKAEGGRLVAV